jgi:hypothetical protein
MDNKEGKKEDLEKTLTGKESIPKTGGPDKLSDAEAEILKRYLGDNSIDKKLEEEMENLKKEIENVHKTISPDIKNPLKNEIDAYLNAKKNNENGSHLPDYIQKQVFKKIDDPEK